ncbi:MAG: F-box and leucine-rich repeat protein 14, partial [Candidatus Hydrogenedentes bacterium]|nr:F-box and leucine-rich repeat protein 14 [Candidatus Hydrogenedentota bacterium]
GDQGGAGLEHLTACPSLRRLEFYDLTDEGMAGLPAIPSLKELSIQGKHPGFSVESMACLARQQGLESLVLRGRFTDDGIAQLKPLVSLKHLGLNSLFQDGDQTTDAALVHLGEMPSLESLDLNTGAHSDAGLGALSGLPNLKRLTIPNAINPGFTDAGFEYVARMRQLEVLGLRAEHFTFEGVRQLEPLTNLKTLVLFLWPKEQATDETIAQLWTMFPNLEYIETHSHNAFHRPQ